MKMKVATSKPKRRDGGGDTTSHAHTYIHTQTRTQLEQSDWPQSKLQPGQTGSRAMPVCMSVCVRARKRAERKRERQHSRVLKQLRTLIRLQAEISLDDENSGTGLEEDARRTAGGGVGPRTTGSQMVA